VVSEGVAGAVRAGQRWAQRRQQLVDPQCTEITSAANSYVSCFNLFINAHRRSISRTSMSSSSWLGYVMANGRLAWPPLPSLPPPPLGTKSVLPIKYDVDTG